MSALSPGKVFQNHVILLERNLILICSLTMLMFPLSASVCREIHDYVKTESQWVLFALLASSS